MFRNTHFLKLICGVFSNKKEETTPMTITFKINEDATISVFNRDKEIGYLHKENSYWRFYANKDKDANTYLFNFLLEKDVETSKRVIINKFKDIKRFCKDIE